MSPDVIDVADPSDPRLDDFRDLNSVDRRPDLPSGKGLVIAEGVLVVQRMLASRFTPRAMMGTDRRLQELADDLRDVPAPYYRVDADVMAEVVGFHLNRGVLASASRPAELSVADVLDGARTLAVLEGVNDHENLGSIFRNARAFGADAVLLDPETADPLGRRPVRVSLGHVLHVPFARLDPWPGSLELVREAGLEVVALARPGGDGASAPPSWREALPERAAFLVGAEGPGLTDRALAAADRCAWIPMAPGVDSINVATAAAIVLNAHAERWPRR